MYLSRFQSRKVPSQVSFTVYEVKTNPDVVIPISLYRVCSKINKKYMLQTRYYIVFLDYCHVCTKNSWYVYRNNNIFINEHVCHHTKCI